MIDKSIRLGKLHNSWKALTFPKTEKVGNEQDALYMRGFDDFFYKRY